MITNCPKCGDKCTNALASMCKCGWEQIGNGHEALIRERDEALAKAEAYREVAITHYDTLENHTRHEDSPNLVDAEAKRVMENR